MLRRLLIGVMLWSVSVLCVKAENQTDSIVPYQRPAIFEDLTNNSEGGSVTLFQDERIETVIASKINGNDLQTMDVSGFRLQVYSSNVPQTSKKEAFDIEQDMKSAYPDIPVYVIYQPPFWKVRLGDFRHQTEADLLRQDVITRFPNIKGDVYLVKDMIQVAK